MAGSGSPFDCDGCSEKDREQRNCFNRLGLSDHARAVSEYTPTVTRELKEKGGVKVFSLGDIRLYECPVSYITEDTVLVMRLVYLTDEIGVLLYEGGFGAQPAWFVEALEIFRGERVRSMREKADG